MSKQLTSSLLVCAFVGMASTSYALTQPDGVTIPELDPTVTQCIQGDDIQVCLDEEEGGNTIDAQASAAVTPETYVPTCSLTFRVIGRGGGFRNAFGWYNVVDSKPSDSDLHSFLECSDNVGTTKVLDIRNDPHYKGGEIGFFMASPEGTNGNCPTFNPDGGPVAGTVGHVYYSQREYNPDNVGADSYIHLITYNSITHANSFYFGWEDLLSGGDNDFEDLLTRVEGIQCTGGGQACETGFDGQCSFGTMQCRNGELECVQNELPVSEMCNGVDDDCNGSIDDGDLCSGNKICHKGKCVPPCGNGEFVCPVDLKCNEDSICVEPACISVSCNEGEICVDGVCKGWCDNITCPYGQVCRAGVCVDPCDTITCDSGYYCEMGVCLISCVCGQCPPDLACDESTERCVGEGCMGVSCEEGQHCEAGQCIDNCQGVTCPSGQVCVVGDCVDNDSDAGTDGGSVSFDGGFFPNLDGGNGGNGGKGGKGSSGNGSAGKAGDDDGSCGCSTPGKHSPAGLAGMMMLLLAAGLRKRRE